MGVKIWGIQEAQRDNEKRIANLRPAGSFGRAIQYATIQAHRYAASITHVDTGGLRAAHRMSATGLRGMIYIDPDASYISRSGKRKKPSQYGPIEHERGGKHAFYARTYAEAGTHITRAAGEGVIAGL